MKYVLPVFLAGLIAGTILLFYLNKANGQASGGRADRSFFCYDRVDQAAAQNMLTYWLQDPKRSGAVETVIRLDLLLMILYCAVFCCIVIQWQKKATIKWVRRMVALGIFFFLTGTIIDAIQDGLLYHTVHHRLSAADMRWLTRLKYALLVFGMLSPLLLVPLPRGAIGPKLLTDLSSGYRWMIRFLSQLLKSVWLFFPCILFLLLTAACFWYAGQGKDMILAFTWNKNHSVNFGYFHWSYTRLFFFIAIGFWVYLSWYASRIICYIKVEKQKEVPEEIAVLLHTRVPVQARTYPAIRSAFLIQFPRLIGQACFILLELAILQSPLNPYPISPSLAITLLLELLLAFYFINNWVENKMASRKYFSTFFYTVLILFLASVLVASFWGKVYLTGFLFLLLLMHLLFIVYSNWRRQDLIKTKRQMALAGTRPVSKWRAGVEKILRTYCIPLEEFGYFKWLLIIGLLGIAVYLCCIKSLSIARLVGPFSFVFLGFSVLLAFGYLVTAYSVKTKLNLHFVLFLLAFLFGTRETHWVRTTPGQARVERPLLKEYLKAWMNKNDPGAGLPINMYFVMSNGGASRSGYWTAQVLGKIQDASLGNKPNQKFSDQLFCLSGTSGGGVGVAAFFSCLRDRQESKTAQFQQSLAAYLKQDYFTYTFARLMGPDFFRYTLPFIRSDRAAKLEESFEDSHPDSPRLFPVSFKDRFSDFPALTPDHKINLPVLCINTTRVQDGNPGVVSNLLIDDSSFNKRVDVIGLLEKMHADISMASGAILGARFPYLSPAGRIGNHYFVDGGYFDNSGAGVVQEIIHAIVNAGRDMAGKDSLLRDEINRIHFHVIHIVNSPPGADSSVLKPISSIQNDLFAPILTIFGAYDMQTTVNDHRLRSYLKDLNHFSADGRQTTDYTMISLYETSEEWKRDSSLNRQYDSEPAYPMNWFMSDTTIDRIDKRLNSNDTLNELIRRIREN